MVYVLVGNSETHRACLVEAATLQEVEDFVKRNKDVEIITIVDEDLLPIVNQSGIIIIDDSLQGVNYDKN